MSSLPDLASGPPGPQSFVLSAPVPEAPVHFYCLEARAWVAGGHTWPIPTSPGATAARRVHDRPEKTAWSKLLFPVEFSPYPFTPGKCFECSPFTTDLIFPSLSQAVLLCKLTCHCHFRATAVLPPHSLHLTGPPARCISGFPASSACEHGLPSGSSAPAPNWVVGDPPPVQSSQHV